VFLHDLTNEEKKLVMARKGILFLTGGFFA